MKWALNQRHPMCFEWAFDNVDRRTQMTMDFPLGHVKRTFGYSVLDQLTTSNTSVVPATGNTTNSTNTYAVDTNDNRTKLTSTIFTNGTIFGKGVSFKNSTTYNNTTNYANNLADQTTAAGALALSFTQAGSVKTISGGNTSQFTYDYKDQLVSFTSGPTTVSYKFDQNNQMMARTVNGTTSQFFWDGGQLTKEYDSGGNVAKRYFIGLEREAAFQNGHWHLLMSDHQGSTVGVVDNQLRVEETNLYSDFGQLDRQFKNPAITNVTDVDYMWTGQRFDSAIGHYYMLNRFYNPSLGKFLQRDPIRYGGGDNMYAFGGGDPINRADSSGLQWLFVDPVWEDPIILEPKVPPGDFIAPRAPAIEVAAPKAPIVEVATPKVPYVETAKAYGRDASVTDDWEPFIMAHDN